jgi:hypothetical protein
MKAQVETDHNRWAITPPVRETRRVAWLVPLGDNESASPRHERASQPSGIALASRVKVLVAHVVARS